MHVALVDCRTVPRGAALGAAPPVEGIELQHRWAQRAQQPLLAELVAVSLGLDAEPSTVTLTQTAEAGPAELLQGVSDQLEQAGATHLLAWGEAPLWHLQVACRRHQCAHYLWQLLERQHLPWHGVHWCRALDLRTVCTPSSGSLLEHATALGADWAIKHSTGSTLHDWCDGDSRRVAQRSAEAVQLLTLVMVLERAFPIIEQWGAE